MGELKIAHAPSSANRNAFCVLRLCCVPHAARKYGSRSRWHAHKLCARDRGRIAGLFARVRVPTRDIARNLEIYVYYKRLCFCGCVPSIFRCAHVRPPQPPRPAATEMCRNLVCAFGGEVNASRSGALLSSVCVLLINSHSYPRYCTLLPHCGLALCMFIK